MTVAGYTQGPEERTPVLTEEDRKDLRRGWLAVQGHRCAVCRTGTATGYTYGAVWLIDYQRDHGEQECPKGDECFDCVTGIVCRTCMLLLHNYRRSSVNIPVKWVNGMDPAEWGRRAEAHINLGVISGTRQRRVEREFGG